jgi:lipoprotein-anchoring transpeptidase ErfK/SrfK
MRSRVFIITATVLTLLLAGVGGIYAYDQSGRDTIPKGVKVAGIDVGGLTATKAKAKLEQDYLTRLRRPVKVYHGSDTFVLTPAQSQVKTDLDAAVDQALEEANSGNMFTRTFRRLTGGSMHADLAPATTYSKNAVVKFLDKVRHGVDRDPQDAKVDFVNGAMKVQEGRDGLAVLAHDLHMQIRKAVMDPSADHTLVAHTEHTPPKVSEHKIDKEYSTALVVDRGSFRLKLYKKFHLVKTYPIAVGMQGLETPAGLYHIQNKAVDPAWTMPNSSWVAPSDRGRVIPGGTAGNPLKARWLGIFDGAGIHGIDPSEYGSIGHAASHGCVRMTIDDVIDLYPQVPVGAPIYIS